MNGQSVVHRGDGIFFGAKNKRALKPWKDVEESAVYYYQVKEASLKSPHPVGFQLYDILGKAKLRVKRSVVARGWGAGGMNGQNRGFWGQWKYCVVLEWWIPVIMHLFKCTEWAAPKMNPDINDGLWVIMMCPCRSTHWTKCATPGVGWGAWVVGGWIGGI